MCCTCRIGGPSCADTTPSSWPRGPRGRSGRRSPARAPRSWRSRRTPMPARSARGWCGRGPRLALRARHGEAARSVLRAGAALDDTLELIDQSFAELEQLAAGLAILRELTPRTTDYLIARGERLTARLVAAALAAADCPCAYVDAVDVVRTDGTFGAASADLKLTERRARRALRPLLARGVVPIVPGFLGAAPDGQVATLGRGGSDLTATLLARARGAPAGSVRKGGPRLSTADPALR